MKKKIIYMLALMCCLNFYSSAKQLGTNCTKKCCAKKTADFKKQPIKIKKITTANMRPLHFYLFNI
jgi:hypothetical protein